MAYKISILEEAAAEVVRAALFYKEINEKLSTELLLNFFETVSYISKNPFANKVIRKNFRKSIIRKFPYKVIYRLNKKEEIIIVAFAHQKRKPYYWKKR